MAGPLDIQRLPYGLVDLLGMKGNGDTPHTLGDSIAVTLADGADYYLAPRRSIVSGDTAIAIAAGGSFAAVGVTPSPGEIWLVYSITATLDIATAAASALKFAGNLTRGSVGDVILTESVSVGATDLDARCRVFERPMIALPGDQFGVRCFTITGAPGSKGRIRLDVARLAL